MKVTLTVLKSERQKHKTTFARCRRERDSFYGTKLRRESSTKEFRYWAGEVTSHAIQNLNSEIVSDAHNRLAPLHLN